MQTIYFDNAATTPIDKDIIEVITKTMNTSFGNPSSSHQFGRQAKALIEQSRKSIAKSLNCSASEIIFTAGGSEADNLILRNAVNNLGVQQIVTTKIEHHAVLNTVKALKEEFDITVKYVEIDAFGDIKYDHLTQLLKESNQKTLVSLMHVNNELGNILDLDKVCEICNDHEALFHSDTVQGIVHVPIDLQLHPIDFIAASAHKFHGPKGVGFAYFKKGFGIKPILIGGEQEKGARAGTENLHNIVGMERAMSLGLENYTKDKNHVSNLKQYFVKLLRENFTEIQFNGNSSNPKKSAFHILNVRFSKDYPMLLFQLDLNGIAASGGSACQSGSHKGSHVLIEILDPKETMKTSVRFSFSKYNTNEEVDYVIKKITEIIS